MVWELVSGLMLLTQEEDWRCTKNQGKGCEQIKETIVPQSSLKSWSCL